jgi:rSAM-partnered protein
MTDGDTTRTTVDAPRSDATREWETFRRVDPDEPLRHVGSVTAPTAETAHEHADRLFPDAGTLWLCPADAVARFSTRRLGADAEPATGTGTGTKTETETGSDGETTEVSRPGREGTDA